MFPQAYTGKRKTGEEFLDVSLYVIAVDLLFLFLLLLRMVF